MADGGGNDHRKRKLPSMAELLSKGKELLGLGKKKERKPRHYEFGRDPSTGLRNDKGTYKGQPKKRRTEFTSEVSGLESEDFPDDLSLCESESIHSSSSACASTMKGQMKDILLEAQELLTRLQESTGPPKRQKWAERQALLNESWEEHRSLIFKALLLSTYLPKDALCNRCMKKEAVVKCHMCSSARHLCDECDHMVHKSSPFHDRNALVNGYYLPIPVTTARSFNGEWKVVARSLPITELHCMTCGGLCKPQEILTESHCIVVTLQGRFDINHQRYQCLDCNEICYTSEPVVVTQAGFWPGSIKDMTYVFDQDLFLYWDILQKQVPGVSEHSFLKSLELFSKHKGRVATINASAFGTSFKEWKYCQFELDKLRQIDWMECPACSNHQHSVHIDGNMKLYRFKSAGVRKRDCYYGETFVSSNEKVDSHIHKVYQGAKQRKTDEHGKCGDSNWRAAANTIKKKKNLSETGLEIAGCRHGLAQRAVNMIYGEVYGYAHYLQVNYFIPKKVEFFWYDVVCKYWPWLKKNDAGAAQKMKPALSVMHAKAHSWSCQVLWGGRWQNDAAGTTGEEVEQINSHFSRLGSCTKHMLPEGREELLTEHSIHWNRRKIEGLPKSLAKRYTKAQNQLKKVSQEIKEQYQSIGMNRADVCIESWKSDVLLAAKEDEASYHKKPQLSKEEELYLGHLLSLQDCTPKQKLLCETADHMYGKKFRDLEPKRCANYIEGEAVLVEKAQFHFQKQMEHFHYSVTQLAVNMGKLADGSKQRQKLRKKITAEKTNLKEVFDKYKRLANDGAAQLQDIENGRFPWKAELSSEEVLPLRTKRLVVEKHMEHSRFQEEIRLIEKEMVGLMIYYKRTVLPSLTKEQEQLQALLKDIEKEEDEDKGTGTCSQASSKETASRRYATSAMQKQVISAKLALIHDGRHFAMKQIAAGISAFAPVLTEDLDVFRQFLLSHDTEIEEDDDEESINGDETEEDTELLSNSGDNDLVVGKESGNTILGALSNLSALPVPTVFPEDLAPGVACWKFPQEISQGQYKDRNGSNACSLISILIGYTLSVQQFSPPDRHSSISSILVDVLCGCIEIGNRIYDLCRDSLPSRYLSIQEAASILEMWVDVEVGVNLPVRLTDQHILSTVSGQFQEAIVSYTTFVAFLILNEKTSLFYFADGKITYIDTHCHKQSGAVVVTAEKKELDYFCNAVFALEENDENTFGNLAFVTFKK